MAGGLLVSRADAALAAGTASTTKVYAIPFSAQANLLFIRKDWLTKLGLSEPKTWDDVMNVAKAFTTQDPDGNGKADTYGIDVPGSTQRGYISWYWSTFFWQAGGEYFKDAGNGKFTASVNSDAGKQSLKWFESLYCGSPKVVQPSSLNDTTTETNKAFQTGVTGMYFTGPYAFATMDNSAVKGKYEVIGDVPNVIFPTGLVHDPDTDELRLYYGAADTTVAMASARLSEVIDYLLSLPPEPPH